MSEVSENDSTLITLTADIVAAHVTNNSVAVADLPSLIQNVHGALSNLGKTEPAAETKQEPAVSVRASIKPDYIVCLEDGKKLKMLKRHLMTHYQMTPADYRSKWNLPADYPMVAPNYAESAWRSGTCSVPRCASSAARSRRASASGASPRRPLPRRQRPPKPPRLAADAQS